MDNNGFGSVRLIGYDHNWDGAGSYAIQLMQAAPNAFAGVAFHCYGVRTVDFLFECSIH